jgi:hypothetical protein
MSYRVVNHNFPIKSDQQQHRGNFSLSLALVTCSCSATNTRRPSNWRSRLAGAVEYRPATQKNAAAHLAPAKSRNYATGTTNTLCAIATPERSRGRSASVRDRTLNWRR